MAGRVFLAPAIDSSMLAVKDGSLSSIEDDAHSEACVA